MIRVLGCLLLFLSLSATADAPTFVAPQIVGDAMVTPLSETQGSAEQGRQIFVSRQGGHCVLCHQVDGLEAPFQGNIGPALSDIGVRLSAGQIRLRIADASTLNAKTIMPPYYRIDDLHRVEEKYQGVSALSDSQIEHLVAYLTTLGSDEP